MKNVRNVAIILLAALVLTFAPGGGPALSVALTVVTIGFFTAIALFGYRLYRENRTFVLDAMGTPRRLAFYSAVGLAFLTFAATSRLFGFGVQGVIVWIALLGAASYTVFWVFMART